MKISKDYRRPAALRLFTLYVALGAGTGIMLTGPVEAQSLFDNGKGDGSLTLRGGGRLEFNFAEKLANLTFTTSKFRALADEKFTKPLGPLTMEDDPVGTGRRSHLERYLFSLRAKPDDSSANLFGSGRPGTGAGVTFGYGVSHLASSIPSPEDRMIQFYLAEAVSHVKEHDKVPASWKIKPRQELKDADDAAQKILDELTKAKETALQKKKDAIDEKDSIAYSEANEAVKEATQKVEEATNQLQNTPFTRREADRKELITQQKLREKKHLGRNPELDQAIDDLDKGVPVLTAAQVAALRSPYGRHRSAADFDHLEFRINLDYDRFKLADVDANGDATMIGNKSTTKIDGLLAYNIQFGNEAAVDPMGKKKRVTPLLIGLAAGYGRKDNRDDLSPIKTSAAYLRSDFRETDAWKLNSDFAFSPGVLDNQVWLNVFTRSTFSNAKPEYRYGLGVFITEKGNTFKSVGGVAVSFASHESLRVDLILGFNFGG